MVRVKTQDDFIQKAQQIHHGKYDYSKVVYEKSSQKVVVICPQHGEFLITPNKHLQGQGCGVCSRELRLENNRIKFIRNAMTIHGKRYDYSKVDFHHVSDGNKVCIVCREHGDFYQNYSQHISAKHECPICASISGGRKRAGDNNVMRRASVKDKVRNTCLQKYGATTWSASEEGRIAQRDIVLNSGVLEKMQQTCMSRYGATTWSASEDGRVKLSEIMSSDEMKQKVKNGYLQKYGMVHYMQTLEGRNKAKAYMSEDKRQKIQSVMLERYGAASFIESDKFQENLELYQKKAWQTKREAGTFNTSKPEATMLLLLYDVFGQDDVLSQYHSDVYPFSCDFYIKSLDLYIELNAHWSHGGHWFDENNPDDLMKLQEWTQKAMDKGSRYYRLAIDVWTRRDLLKLKAAVESNLNYLVFWRMDLKDFREWLHSYCSL